MELFVNLIIGIAWPALIGGIVYSYLEELRGVILEIQNAIRRTRGIGRGVWHIDPSPQTPAPLGNPIDNPLPDSSQAISAQKKPPLDFILPKYRPFFSSLVQLFNDNAPDLYRKVEGSEKDVLIAVAAEFAGALYLERATRFILGSQIEALRSLQERTGVITKEMFSPFYEEGKKLFPLMYENYDFAQWFQFLVAMGLVKEDGNKIIITEAGKVAHFYMDEKGYKRPLG